MNGPLSDQEGKLLSVYSGLQSKTLFTVSMQHRRGVRHLCHQIKRGAQKMGKFSVFEFAIGHLYLLPCIIQSKILHIVSTRMTAIKFTKLKNPDEADEKHS